MEWDALPGGDLVERGIDDLADGRVTEAALLVSIGVSRLRQLGLVISDPLDEADHRLWALLAEDDADAAHSRYNALLRRLVSFEQALAALERVPSVPLGANHPT